MNAAAPMIDLAELFPDLADARPPRDGYALRPIGRPRRGRGPPRIRNRAPTLAMLAQIRSILDHQLGGMRQSLLQLEQNVGRLADSQASLAEDLARLQRRMVAVERNTAVRPPPEIPTHTRRSAR